MAAIGVGQYVAQRVPSMLPALFVELCEATGFASNASCTENYEASSFGQIWTQVALLDSSAHLI